MKETSINFRQLRNAVRDMTKIHCNNLDYHPSDEYKIMIYRMFFKSLTSHMGVYDVWCGDLTDTMIISSLNLLPTA